MANFQQLDFVQNNEFQSVYSPIKYTFRVNGANASGQTATVKDYVSLYVHITPYNLRTDQWLNGSSGSNPLPNESYAFRVPYSAYIDNFAANSTPNDGTYRYFSTDISSLLRAYHSYDLRPCGHDVEIKGISRDITMSQIAENVTRYWQVSFRPEYINTSGVLTKDNDNIIYSYPRTVNAALTYQEEIDGYFATEHHDEDETALSGNAQQQGAAFEQMFLHHPNNERNYNRQRYLSVKSTASRVIGVDESEYVTFLVYISSQSYIPEVYIEFHDINGDTISNGSGGVYSAIIDASVYGDGTYDDTNHLLNWGDGRTETRGAVQVGVGTRNIKEMGITHPEKFTNGQSVTDFSKIYSYEVTTIYGGSTARRMGETITYRVDHDRTANRDGDVRFHWQSRLGGIDSYTFDGLSTRGIETSSSTFEQSIYPSFNAQLSSTSSGANIWGGYPINTADSEENTGALINRVAGLTDDKYPAIRKHQVNAYGTGMALSKPIAVGERNMFEDLMSSPNVWIERGWHAKELLFEDFSAYSAVADIADNWTDVSTGDFTTDASFPTGDGHTTGTKSYKKGNNSGGDDQIWTESKTLFNYHPRKMYEIEIRVKSDVSSDGLLYCGLTGFAADGTTRISSNDGSDTSSNAHYFVASGVNPLNDDTWVTYRGYIMGHIRSGGTYGGDRPNPMNAARAYTGVKKFAPMFILNNAEAGTMYVDYIKVTEYSPAEEPQGNFYSTLNKNYYVPVLVNDGGANTYDSEGFTTVSVDYTESRKKRTIRN